MDKEPVNQFAAYVAGLQATVVHLAQLLVSYGGLDAEAVARSIEHSANILPPGAFRETQQQAMRQLAEGLRRSASVKDGLKLVPGEDANGNPNPVPFPGGKPSEDS
jgi:hypothetical protein